MSKIKIIPCLSDNYAYLIVDEQTKKNILIDAPEADPCWLALGSSRMQ